MLLKQLEEPKNSKTTTITCSIKKHQTADIQKYKLKIVSSNPALLLLMLAK